MSMEISKTAKLKFFYKFSYIFNSYSRLSTMAKIRFLMKFKIDPID